MPTIEELQKRIAELENERRLLAIPCERIRTILLQVQYHQISTGRAMKLIETAMLGGDIEFPEYNPADDPIRAIKEPLEKRIAELQKERNELCYVNATAINEARADERRKVLESVLKLFGAVIGPDLWSKYSTCIESLQAQLEALDTAKEKPNA